MKTKQIISTFLLFIFITTNVSAWQTAPQKGVNVNNKGASATNSKGAGVVVKKKEVTAKSSSGHGVGVNNKGMEVKGSKGGMEIKKKSFQIKSKNVNIHIGK